MLGDVQVEFRRFRLFAAVALLACGCATVERRPLANDASEQWDTVIRLPAGTRLVVFYRFDSENPPVRQEPGGEATALRVLGSQAIEGVLRTSNASSAAVRMDRGDGATIVLPREVVTAVDLIERGSQDPRTNGLLIGAAAGLGSAAIAGIFRKGDLEGWFRAIVAGGFAAAGALIGRSIDGRHVGEVRRRIYEVQSQ